MKRQFLFDGRKSVPIDQLPDEAWTYYGTVSGDAATLQERYIRVPFLNRAVGIRANAVSTLPFAILNRAGDQVDSSDDYQNALGFLPNPQRLLYLVEASLFLLGQAYLFRLRNRVKTLGLRYVLATSIAPVLSEQDGLVGFTRQLSRSKMDLAVDDLVYFWQLDPFVEVGPANNSPGMAALSAAGVLYNVDQFASTFFERGAIKVTLLTTKGPVPEQERDRLKQWWSRLFKGADSAWKMAIVQADSVEPVVLGEGVKELSDSELVAEKRTDIAVAAGVPVTMLWSTEASGLGGGGVVESDERKFYETTVVPQARFIEAALNEQLFGPLGYSWQFRPETLDVFQEDESQRASAVKMYVDAGFRLSLAAEILGVELPAGVEYEDLDRMQQEDLDAATERQRRSFEQRAGAEAFRQREEEEPSGPERAAMEADMKRWERKALAKGADCPFESAFIPADVAQAIRVLLSSATTDEEVKAAFRGPFCHPAVSWEAYP